MKTLDGYKVIKDTGYFKRHSSNPDDNLFAVTVLDRGSLEREAAILRKCSGHENLPSLHGVTRVDDGECGLVYDIPYGEDTETLSSGGELLDKNTLRLTLIGFGNAFHIDDAAKPCGHGDYHYMAPETVLDNGTASLKADVWSLGMVLALLFTGLQPYHEYEPANIAKFREMHADNQSRPRYAQTRSNNVDMKHYIGQGKAMEQVGTLINLAVCPTQELRLPVQQLLGAFAMLLTEET